MRDRIKAWRNGFDQDESAVLPTLLNYAWNYAAFSAIAKAVEICPSEETNGVRFTFALAVAAFTVRWN